MQSHASHSKDRLCAAVDAFVDQQLLHVLSIVDAQLKQDFRQVVLVGDGVDTRPFRYLHRRSQYVKYVCPGCTGQVSQCLTESSPRHKCAVCALPVNTSYLALNN